MSYIYTQRNILEEPQNYMYSSYEGASFIDYYSYSRKEVLDALSLAKDTTGIDSDSFILIGITIQNRLIEQFTESVTKFNLETLVKPRHKKLSWNSKYIALSDEDIDTKEFLKSFISSQILDIKKVQSYKSFDRLVQKFEVTKKIYKFYPAGFGKGEEGSKEILSYCLFSLSLLLAYLDTKKLKYLSTFLKTNDLLISLERPEILKLLPIKTICLLVISELIFVEELKNRKKNYHA